MIVRFNSNSVNSNMATPENNDFLALNSERTAKNLLEDLQGLNQKNCHHIKYFHIFLGYAYALELLQLFMKMSRQNGTFC